MKFEEVNSSSFTIFFTLGRNKYVLNVGSFCEISSLSWHGTLFKNVIMRALYSDVKINWSYFIAHHMAKLKDGPTTSGLGYVILWTKIFKYFNVDFSNILQKSLKGPNCINYATLRQMGRGLAQEQPQQAQQDQAGPHEQEHQAGPSEHPSMRDMMQVLLRIEQNQANMDTHLTRVDQRLSRIEQYLKIEEDEDQD
ncbi:hypothetical protein PIB30_107191 [Stylosanthes scabra]|uniref:Uncharacterized protein n=1 Tax=Stylosanthes scabra TaxID=79078 RepID=A0ABU6VXP7_9FABA|nr:hypothetical protein [Stylosanthes scabra]